jgi:hypothetical protein
VQFEGGWPQEVLACRGRPRHVLLGFENGQYSVCRSAGQFEPLSDFAQCQTPRLTPQTTQDVEGTYYNLHFLLLSREPRG